MNDKKVIMQLLDEDNATEIFINTSLNEDIIMKRWLLAINSYTRYKDANATEKSYYKKINNFVKSIEKDHPNTTERFYPKRISNISR